MLRFSDFQKAADTFANFAVCQIMDADENVGVVITVISGYSHAILTNSHLSLIQWVIHSTVMYIWFIPLFHLCV